MSSTDAAASTAEQLRARGITVTAQRVAVLEAVHRLPHATTDQIGDAAREHIGSISRQSVYDTLALMVDHELVRLIQPRGSVARYEGRVGDNHHHLVCRGCNVMFDIDCAVGGTPCLTAADDHGFLIDEAEVVYWGYCPGCRAT